MTKTIVVVEDNSGLRKQIQAFLSKADDIECIYSVASGEEALAKIPLQPPDVVIMDIGLPKMSGIECVSALKKVVPFVDILIYTVYEDTDYIFRALKAGASGYVLKSSGPADLLKAIRDIHGDAAPLSGAVARKIIRYFQIEGSRQGDVSEKKLSPREVEILKCLAAGSRYKEIAIELNIGVETVRTHIKRICKKLHVRSCIEAVAKYYPKTV